MLLMFFIIFLNIGCMLSENFYRACKDNNVSLLVLSGTDTDTDTGTENNPAI